jgi:hypothetical protein
MAKEGEMIGGVYFEISFLSAADITKLRKIGQFMTVSFVRPWSL